MRLHISHLFLKIYILSMNNQAWCQKQVEGLSESTEIMITFVDSNENIEYCQPYPFASLPW